MGTKESYIVNCTQCGTSVKIDAEPEIYKKLAINKSRWCKKCLKSFFMIADYRENQKIKQKEREIIQNGN